ncbi:MAG: hypothetical protein PWQ96_2334, partial [Clostridia bacterium]|nr:hypothetical protein [Clostridia bacterium]
VTVNYLGYEKGVLECPFRSLEKTEAWFKFLYN